MNPLNQREATADTIVYPGKIPSTPIIWPSNQHRENQIQQTKATATPQSANVLPTTQPSASAVAPRTTPPAVSRVRVATRLNGSSKTITVQFNHPGSVYFQGASVYLKKGNGQPVQVASGAKSPLTFTVARTAAPHTIHVTSFGPGGETNVLTSPSTRVRLI